MSNQHTDVTLTFDMENYTVHESDGSLEVCVTIVDSNLPSDIRSIVFEASTMSGSAKGTYFTAYKHAY